MSESRLYVIGESGDENGPVKIGLTTKKHTAGLSRGNCRELIELGHVEEDPQVLRWREWLAHRRLRHFMCEPMLLRDCARGERDLHPRTSPRPGVRALGDDKCLVMHLSQGSTD